MQKHFREPCNVGELDDANATGEAENLACGDVVRWTLRVDADARIDAVRFRARACSATVAVASLVSEELSGSDLAIARALDLDALVEAAGGLPPGRAHALEVVRRALEAALASVP